MNEGLETLGTDEYVLGEKKYFGVFEKSGLRHVKLPSTLKRIECGAFMHC